MQLVVKAADGSTHIYPQGHYAVIMNDTPGWLFIEDKTKRKVAGFFRPTYWIYKD